MILLPIDHVALLRATEVHFLKFSLQLFLPGLFLFLLFGLYNFEFLHLYFVVSQFCRGLETELVVVVWIFNRWLQHLIFK